MSFTKGIVLEKLVQWGQAVWRWEEEEEEEEQEDGGGTEEGGRLLGV